MERSRKGTSATGGTCHAALQSPRREEKSANRAGIVTKRGWANDLRHVVAAQRTDIACQQVRNHEAGPCQQVRLVIGHAAAHHDPFRRDGEHQDGEQFRKVPDDVVPCRIVVSQIGGIGLKSCCKGRAGNQPFDTVAMKGARSCEFVTGNTAKADMAHLGVKTALCGMSVQQQPAAQSGPDGQVDYGRAARGRTLGVFRQGSCVDIGIQSDGAGKAFPHVSSKAVPAQFSLGVSRMVP